MSVVSFFTEETVHLEYSFTIIKDSCPQVDTLQWVSWELDNAVSMLENLNYQFPWV